MGGEAYISFKPGLVDANGAVTDENTRQFLQGFIERFAALLAGCSSLALQLPRLEVRPPRLRLQQARHKRG